MGSLVWRSARVPPFERKNTFFRRNTMRQEQLNAPTPQQTKYLGYLLSRAHELGMPHLDTDGFSRRDVSAWIDFLAGAVVRDIQREQVKEEGKEEGASR